MRVDVAAAELEHRQAAATVLQSKLGRPAVVLHTDASGADWVTKVWTRRASFSSDWWYPYHLRFVRHAAELRRRGVAAPEVDRWGNVTGTRQRYVTYRHIRGESLRALAARCGDIDVRAFADFVATLHAKGIYFRSLHLGNVLATEAGPYAVIDVTDVAFRRRGLRIGARARNLSFLFSYAEDAVLLGAGFLDAYARACDLDGPVRNQFAHAFQRASARRSG